MKLGIGNLVGDADSEHYNNIDSLAEFIDLEPPTISDYLVCECSCVGIVTISNFLQEFPNATLTDLKKSLNVGVGCGSCVKKYKFLNSLT